MAKGLIDVVCLLDGNQIFQFLTSESVDQRSCFISHSWDSGNGSLSYLLRPAPQQFSFQLSTTILRGSLASACRVSRLHERLHTVGLAKILFLAWDTHSRLRNVQQRVASVYHGYFQMIEARNAAWRQIIWEDISFNKRLSGVPESGDLCISFEIFERALVLPHKSSKEHYCFLLLFKKRHLFLISRKGKLQNKILEEICRKTRLRPSIELCTFFQIRFQVLLLVFDILLLILPAVLCLFSLLPVDDVHLHYICVSKSHGPYLFCPEFTWVTFSSDDIGG